MRADAVGNPVGLSVHHRDAAIVDAEGGSADLRHSGLEPLPHRGAAGDDFDRAVRVHRDSGAVGRAAPAFLEEGRDAGADQLARSSAAGETGTEVVPAHRVQRLPEQQRIVAAVEVERLGIGLVVGDGAGQLFGGNQVAPADLDRIDAEAVRGGVHQPLADEARLEPPGRAVGRGGRLVGQADVAGRPERRHPVEAGQRAHRAVGHAHPVGPEIGALVVPDLGLQGEDASLGVDGEAGLVALLAALVGGHKVFLAVLDPLDRACETPRGQQHQQVLGIELAANPEPAPDMALEQVDALRREPQHPHQGLLVAVRDLGRAVELQPVARGVVDPDRAARLHRDAGMPPGPEVEGDHLMGLREPRPGIAEGMGEQRRLGAETGRELAGLLVRPGNRRQRVVVDLDQLGRVLGEIGGPGEHGGHRLPDIARAVLRQHVLAIGLEGLDLAVGTEVDGRDVGDVGAGPHRMNPRHRQRGRGIDGPDLRVGVRRADDPHVELAGEVDVAGEAPPPGDQRRILDPRERPAEQAFVVAHRGPA